MKKHKFNILPEMLEDEFLALKNDMQAKGYDGNLPIVLYENDILDGWNRFRACNELNISPEFIEFEGTEIEALEYVMRTNKRRNLTSSQWAVIAVEADPIMERLKQEAKARQIRTAENRVVQKIAQQESGMETRSLQKAAKLFNTNRNYIKEAQKIKIENPQAFEAIRNGEKTIAEIKKEQRLQENKEKLIEQREQFSQIASIIKNEYENTIINADCLTWLKEYNPPIPIRLLLSDPPYGMAFQSNRRIVSVNSDKIKNDTTYEESMQLTANMLKLAIPKLANDAHIILFCNDEGLFHLRKVIENSGLTFKRILVWVKANHGSGDLKSFAPKKELAIYATKGRPEITPRKPDVFISQKKQQDTTHPTEKPIELLKEWIECTTQEGDIVLDPFLGSGSTAVATKILNRLPVGTELDINYYNETLERLYGLGKSEKME